MNNVVVVPSGPFICNVDGGSISYDAALTQLKAWCKSSRIDKDVGFHSLRRGGATHMHEIGINLQDIRMAGDWQSMCVLIYLSSSPDRKLEIAKKMARSLAFN